MPYHPLEANLRSQLFDRQDFVQSSLTEMEKESLLKESQIRTYLNKKAKKEEETEGIPMDETGILHHVYKNKKPLY